ncbi:putative ATPase [Prauserella shujinwangii]|uniref:Putative ATPase n=1 Tax=Prauserella shujinwangii TaxID=1453103 RepID=A0A2T0LRL4_9PSEU|nr:BTAD domain-containing putative transcriptional regulator [Prauserella shujinwangii]PRX46128.1 putative ATPase [Prauserella shujinwangii]
MAVELVLLTRVSYRGREITGPRLRGLLALLADDLRTGCGTARLVEGLWPDARPEHPTKALQILVSRARARLGGELIESTPAGYRLALREDEVDASAVLRRATAAARCLRAGEYPAALSHADAGLALWDGAPDDPPPGWADPVAALRADRAPAHQELARTRALALAGLGRYAEATGELARVFARRSRDEEILHELLRSEAATAGPAAALARFDAYRRGLRDDLGTDPGPALRALHEQLLRGTAPAVRRGVPHEPNPLLGREADVTAVTELLRTARVTSIVGIGGLGKTRLAHAVAHRTELPVVHFVALAGIARDTEVADEVAAALGAGESRRTPVGAAATDSATAVTAALGGGPALLVLDNCEHVVAGVADLVRGLVAATRDLRVLTTSRTPLGLTSESVYPLPELDQATTVELFTRRARAARPGADLPAAEVDRLCRHLDGLPLAVELAAARVRVLSVAEITRRLADRFALLRGGARDTPERHHTLRAVVDWSWNLLGDDGRAALRALSVFPGGFTADAAAYVLGGDALELLEHLVDQSLLKVTEERAGTRFRMLETVREFSAGHREAAGETDSALRGFLAWARDFGTAHHASVFGPEPRREGERIRAEQDNLLQALRHAIARDDTATVAATAAALGGLWIGDSDYTRMVPLIAEIVRQLSHVRPEPGVTEAARAAATLCTAYCLTVQGSHLARALFALRRLPPAAPDTPVRAAATVLCRLPELAGSGPAALDELCDGDEPLVAGFASALASYAWHGVGDVDRALAASRRMIDVFAAEATPWMLLMAHSRMGELCLQINRGEEGRRHLRAALALMEEAGTWPDTIGIRWALVVANLQLGAVDEAEEWLSRVAPDLVEDDLGLVTFDLAVRAEIRLARGDVEGGLRRGGAPAPG